MRKKGSFFALFLLIVFCLASLVLKYDYAQQSTPQAKDQAHQADIEKEPEKIIPSPKNIKESTAIYVFLVWTWIGIFVLIYILRLKIKEVGKNNHILSQQEIMALWKDIKENAKGKSSKNKSHDDLAKDLERLMFEEEPGLKGTFSKDRLSPLFETQEVSCGRVLEFRHAIMDAHQTMANRDPFVYYHTLYVHRLLDVSSCIHYRYRLRGVYRSLLVYISSGVHYVYPGKRGTART